MSRRLSLTVACLLALLPVPLLLTSWPCRAARRQEDPAVAWLATYHFGGLPPSAATRPGNVLTVLLVPGVLAAGLAMAFGLPLSAAEPGTAWSPVAVAAGVGLMQLVPYWLYRDPPVYAGPPRERDGS
jgi:hypothetical protein